MSFKVNPGETEIARLVYAKYLFIQGKKFLDNNVVEYYFNISVVLAANAAEILANVLAYCVTGQDQTKERISNVLKNLRKLSEFPYSELNRVIEARNGVYHRVQLSTYNTCKELNKATERALVKSFQKYFSIDYFQISMVDLISDSGVRTPLKRGEEQLKGGNLVDAVVSTCEAFAMLKHRIDNRGSHQIKKFNRGLSGSEVSWRYMEKKLGIEKKVIRPGEYDTSTLLRLFSEHVEEQVNKKVEALARHLNFLLMLGSSYEDYKHFESIEPLYHVTLGGFRCKREDVEKKNYEIGDVEFMFNFVLRITLELEPKLRPIEVKNLNEDVIMRIE